MCAVDMLYRKRCDFGFFFTWVFLILCFQSHAQHWLPDFKHFTTRDGLPSSEVYQITSDPQNNIWFCTDRGVVRYDGYSFRTYDFKDSLPDNSVIKLYKDYAQRIWFISYTGLLSYYQDGKIIPYKYNNIITKSFKNSIVTTLYVDTSENVHLNFLSGRMFTITASGQLTEQTVKIENYTYVLNIPDSFSVTPNYIAGKNRLPTTIKVQSLQDTFSFNLNEKMLYKHFAATRFYNRDIVFYCDQILVRISPDGTYKVKKFDASVLNVFEDADRDIWIGTTQGVYFCDSALNVKSRYLTQFSVSHIHGDFEGGYWLSTLENGIFYLTSKNNSFFAVGDEPLSEKITDIFNLSDSLLLFTSSTGKLYQYSKNKFEKYDVENQIGTGLEYVGSVYFNNRTKSIVLGAYMKISTDTVCAYFSRWKDNKVIVIPTLAKLLPCENDSFAGSGFNEILILKDEKLKISGISSEFIRPTSLFKDSKGNLLVGTMYGLGKWTGTNVVAFDKSEMKLRTRISEINELNNEYLVIGTRSNGIIIYRDSLVCSIGNTDGLTSEYINCITIEGNIIWAGTNRGISRITVTGYDPFSYTIDQININNDLVSNEVNDIIISKNLVYVATNVGLSVLNIDYIKSYDLNVPCYITSFRVNERDTTLGLNYALNHLQNNIGISFKGLSYRNAHNIKYRYRLLGLDTTWRQISNRDVLYSGLPSGNYTFQLIASFENDAFNAIPTEISFSIAPSIYETTWFRISLFALCVILLTILVQYRIKTIRNKAQRENELNKRISELNLNALRSQMNPHFTFNVLNSIKYYIANKDPESAQFYISKFAKLIRLILDQSRSDFIPLSDEIQMLTLYMELEELRFENKFSYSIRTDEKLNTEKIFIPGMLIQPFVENSIKHGIRYKKGNAVISIDFKSSDSVLICTITDNGIGREAAEKNKSQEATHKSAGTSIVNERMEALGILFNGKLKNYTFDLKDEAGKPSGTCVNIEIPFKNTHK